MPAHQDEPLRDPGTCRGSRSSGLSADCPDVALRACDAPCRASNRAKLHLGSIITLLILTAILVSTLDQPATQAWSGDPNVNTLVCNASQDQLRPNIVSDDAGGAIITWYDNHSGTRDIYAQRIDFSGTTLWSDNGIVICGEANNQESPALISDGAGGAIITWHDYRVATTNANVYAQRVDASGTILWTSTGVTICNATYNQQYPTIVSDGAGGAIITWQDGRSSGIYAQRVNASGSVMWTPNGVAICTKANNQQYPTIVSDGAGGAIITWQDYRLATTNAGVYAQRLSSLGVPLWTDNGVAVCNDANNQLYPTIADAGPGGAIITWHDYRLATTNAGIYAQRLSSLGVPLWTDNGVAVCNDAYNQLYPTIASDDADGAIITWYDRRSNTTNDVYARRVGSSGTPLWTDNGVIISDATRDQTYPTIVGDGSGGAIITWQDYRSASTNAQIYSQRVDSSGTPQWDDDGAAISTPGGNQERPTIVGDGSGGAIITWQDRRSGTSYDVYSQRIKSDGSLPIPPTMTAVSPDLGDRGQTISSVTITGTGFITGDTSVSFGPDINVGTLSVDSATQLTVGISIDLAAALGARDVSVATSEGMCTLSGAFTVHPGLLVDFSADRTEVLVGDDVTFTNSSTGGAIPLFYQWDFDNDSSWDSTAENATHAYSTPGTYTAVLRVTDLASNEVTEVKDEYVTVYDTLEADFAANRTAVAVDQTVSFTNLSSGGIPAFAYQWDFGDSENSTAQHPTHAYASAGTYTVELRVTDSAANTDAEAKHGYIVVSDTLDADFNADRTAVVIGQTVQFADASGGGVTPHSYYWDFGDSGSSTAQYPSHAYTSAGTYTVELQVTDSAANTDTETKTAYITVFAGLQADFTADDTVAMAGQGVQFNDGSSGGVAPLSYLWDFGDSGTSSEQNPSHAYTDSGDYTVVLRVTDSADNPAERTRIDYITVVESCDSASSASGTGTVEICTSSGVLEGLYGVPDSSLPQFGKPALIFSHGLFEFEVTGLSSGESVTLTITLPSSAPATTQYWKYGPTSTAPGGEWYSIPVGSNDGDNVITITLRDGGVGDDDLAANGTIVDQGGPGTPRPPEPAPAFPSVYAGIAAALGAAVLAYMVSRRLGHR